MSHKIVVISSNESRRRKKFIIVPLKNAGHETLLLNNKINLYHFINQAISLYKFKPDVVFFIGVGPKYLLYLPLVKFCRIPYVVRLGGDRIKDIKTVSNSLLNRKLYFLWFKNQFSNYACRAFLRNCNTAIVVNDSIKERVSKSLANASKIYTVPQFCDIANETRNYDIVGACKLLTVSNFRYKEKAGGVVWLIRQINSFANRERTPIQFNIIGDGLHLDDIKIAIPQICTGSFLTVKILGHVSDIQASYQSADVLVYRSFHDATPNVILEAKQSGLPVLINRCAEFESLIEHGKSGLMYDSSDEFKSSLNKLMKDQQYRARLGAGAIEHNKKHFSISAIYNLLESVLGDVVNDGNKEK